MKFANEMHNFEPFYKKMHSIWFCSKVYLLIKDVINLEKSLS